MAAPKASVLDVSGKKSKDVSLDESVYAVEVKPHLVHEAVRSELNAQRAGTAATKSRGLVSGGRAKPWRQKGTGRARQGTIRAPQFEGGGHAFAKVPRTFIQKVNRKAAKAALRSALASHVSEGSLAVVAANAFDEPSTKSARALPRRLWPAVAGRDRRDRGGDELRQELPQPAEGRGRSRRASSTSAPVVWARSLLLTETALEAVTGRAS